MDYTYQIKVEAPNRPPNNDPKIIADTLAAKLGGTATMKWTRTPEGQGPIEFKARFEGDGADIRSALRSLSLSHYGSRIEVREDGNTLPVGVRYWSANGHCATLSSADYYPQINTDKLFSTLESLDGLPEDAALVREDLAVRDAIEGGITLTERGKPLAIHLVASGSQAWQTVKGIAAARAVTRPETDFSEVDEPQGSFEVDLAVPQAERENFLKLLCTASEEFPAVQMCATIEGEGGPAERHWVTGGRLQSYTPEFSPPDTRQVFAKLLGHTTEGAEFKFSAKVIIHGPALDEFLERVIKSNADTAVLERDLQSPANASLSKNAGLETLALKASDLTPLQVQRLRSQMEAVAHHFGEEIAIQLSFEEIGWLSSGSRQGRFAGGRETESQKQLIAGREVSL